MKGAPTKDKVRVAAHGLICNDRNEFVVIKQEVLDTYFRDVPGGKVEADERETSTVWREIKEEVGIEVEVQEPLGTWQFTRILDGVIVVSTLYRCRPLTEQLDVAKNPIPFEDITAAKWVTLTEYESDAYPTSDPSLKKLIRATLKP